MKRFGGSSNSLGTMYFLAAVLMAAAALLVAALMFFPTDTFSRSGERWVPGTTDPYGRSSDRAPATDAAADEELHIH